MASDSALIVVCPTRRVSSADIDRLLLLAGQLKVKF